VKSGNILKENPGRKNVSSRKGGSPSLALDGLYVVGISTWKMENVVEIQNFINIIMQGNQSFVVYTD